MSASADTLPVPEDLTPRQGEVLSAALGLLVTMGDKLTMTAVAREARCSKETLYKWFGDRDGLLTATVQWQAAKVGVPVLDRAHLDRASIAQSLEQFARDLLTVLTGETSVALNRIAVTHAGADKSGLGAIVLENGRRAMGRRLKPVLEAGRDVALLKFADSEDAFRTFFGLVVRDVQIRLLLGDDFSLTAAEIDGDAKVATTQFFTLYGVSRHAKPGRWTRSSVCSWRSHGKQSRMPISRTTRCMNPEPQSMSVSPVLITR